MEQPASAEGIPKQPDNFPVGRGGAVRKISLLIGGAVVALAACSGDKKTATNDELKKDLELASTSDGLGVGTGVNQGTQVVSAIERTTPGPKAQATSNRVKRYHKAPTRTVAPVETEAEATVTEPEPTPVSPEPVAADPTPVLPRPVPQTVSYPGGNSGDIGRGSNTGAVLGTILGAVIRGAVVGGMGDGDTCDPRTDGRRGRRGGSIPLGRIPRIGTIPNGIYPTR